MHILLYWLFIFNFLTQFNIIIIFCTLFNDITFNSIGIKFKICVPSTLNLKKIFELFLKGASSKKSLGPTSCNISLEYTCVPWRYNHCDSILTLNPLQGWLSFFASSDTNLLSQEIRLGTKEFSTKKVFSHGASIRAALNFSASSPLLSKFSITEQVLHYCFCSSPSLSKPFLINCLSSSSLFKQNFQLSLLKKSFLINVPAVLYNCCCIDPLIYCIVLHLTF